MLFISFNEKITNVSAQLNMAHGTLLKKLFQRIIYFREEVIKAPHALWVQKNTSTNNMFLQHKDSFVDGI